MRYLLAVLSLVALTPVSGRGFDVTACGQTVPPREVGRLVSDLDCTGIPFPDVLTWLESGAVLDLQGHTMVEGQIRCQRRCEVRGPGTIVDGDVTGLDGRVTVRDFTMLGGGGVGAATETVTAINMVLSGGVVGILARRLRAENVNANDNQTWGIVSTRSLRGANLVANGNGYAGVDSPRVNVVGLGATGNGQAGIVGGGVNGDKIRLRDAVVTGNQRAGAPMDLASKRQPRLLNVTCGYSIDWVNEVTWGVCAND